MRKVKKSGKQRSRSGLVFKRLIYWGLGIGLISYFVIDRAKEKKHSRVISMSYTNTHLPLISACIGKSLASFILDTGGSYCLELKSHLIDAIETKKRLENRHLLNYALRKTNQESFLVEKIRFLDLDIEDLIINSVCDDQEDLTRLPYDLDPLPWKSDDQTFEKHNYLGHEFLKATNCLFDFKNNFFAMFPKGTTPHYRFPYGMNFLFNTSSFDYQEGLGLICDVFTDYGIKKCLLDTGSSITFFKTDPNFKENSSQTTSQHLPKVKLKTFRIGSKSYPVSSVYIFEDFKIEGVDGVIGMDFLHDKTLFIDNHNRAITLF